MLGGPAAFTAFLVESGTAALERLEADSRPSFSRRAAAQNAGSLVESVLAALERERVGSMYLVHGGDMKGIERIAASWAEQHGVQQVRFGLDRRLGDRAGFRRNEQMLSLRPRYVIAFQGNGVTERLVIDAKKAGIRVVDRRGPLGTPPAAIGQQRDHAVV